MGVFDFFKRRRDRESAVAGLSVSPDPSQQVSAMAAGGTVAPQAPGQADGQQGGFDLAQLGQIGALIAQSAQEGDIQVHQGQPQEIDLRGTGLREEILGIIQAHGIDAEAGSGQQIDASRMPDMQRQILDALQQHGVDVPGVDDAGNIQIESSGGVDSGGGDSSGFDSGGDSGGGDSGDGE